MKFECDSCHAQYMIADEKVGKRGVKVKCKRCSHVIVVRPDGAKDAAKDGGKDQKEPAKEPRVEKAAAEAAPKLAPVDSADDGLEAPPPPEPEVTGPSRPAPVPMAADTQLGSGPDLTDMAPPPEPPPPAATELSMPPAAMPDLPAPPPAPAAAAAAPIKGESSIGDALDDQLAGAFNSMFDESRPSLGDLANMAPPSPEEQRGPTQILDLESMNALRRATAGSERVERDALDSLRRDLGPSDESSGLWNENKKASITIGSSGKPIDDGIDLPEWHVAIDDEDVGPITLEVMGQHIASGAVDRQSLVWKTGMSDWLPAGEVPKVKDLFVKAPLPKISPPVDDTAARGRSRPSSFDVGSPIDDLPPAAGGGSPFDNVPGMDESDPHWQPHGLTDVYQAANLAEAATSGALAGGGLVGNAGMAARSGGPSPAPSPSSSSSEPEWRPSASSALASLVNDEIDRLAKGPGLPPADDLAPRPADDAAIGGSLPFSSLGGLSLDAGAEMSDPAAGLGRSSTSQVPAFSSEPSFPQPSFGGPAAFAPPPQPPPPQRSPLFFAGIAGAAVVFLMMSLLTYKVLFDKPQQQVVVVGPGGVPIQPMIDPATGQIIAPVAPQPGVVPPGVPPVAPPVAAPVPAPAPAPAPEPGPPAGDPPPPPPVAEPPPPPPTQVAVNNTRKPPVNNTVKPPPPPPPPPPVSTSRKGCDPVLDFDCKAGGGGGEAKEAAKSTLEKSDILGVVKGSLGKVKDCGAKHGASGTIKMSWNISKSGKPTDVSVADTKYGGTPVGACVTGVVKAMKFPAYSGAAPPTVSIPLPLG